MNENTQNSSFRKGRPVPCFDIRIYCRRCTGKSNETTAPEKPNVLFIIADDYGAHDMSAFGSEFYETPHLDSLVSESMIFTNGYAAARVCSPSKASIMSGKSPARHGITDWIGAPAGKEWRERGRYTKLFPPDTFRHLTTRKWRITPKKLG